MTLIFHILSRDAALVARQNGEYHAESLPREGFIHFSRIHQLMGVAERFYAGQHGLVILAVETSQLKAELKYEAPAHPSAFHALELPENEDFPREKHLKYSDNVIETQPLADDLFPHLYGPLNFDAVVAMHDFEPDSDGQFSLPIALTTDHPLAGTR